MGQIMGQNELKQIGLDRIGSTTIQQPQQKRCRYLGLNLLRRAALYPTELRARSYLSMGYVFLFFKKPDYGTKLWDKFQNNFTAAPNFLGSVLAIQPNPGSPDKRRP